MRALDALTGRLPFTDAVRGKARNRTSGARVWRFPEGAAVVASPPTAALRMRIYRGYLHRIGRMEIAVDDWDEVVPVFPGADLDGYKAALATTKWGERVIRNERENVISAYFDTYYRPVVDALEDAGIDTPVLLRQGDNFRTVPVPAVAKSLPIASPGYGVLLPLRAERHFHPAWEAESADIPFAEKTPTLVWRGNTAGAFADNVFRPAGPRAFVPRWAGPGGDRRLDVGFSSVNATFRNSPLHEDLRSAVEGAIKPRLTIAQMLRHRYVLVLEGQDTATGLKWALNSNSVVVMPLPRILTWAAEKALKPFVHFIPVRSDLADLPAMLDWCEDNLPFVQTVAENGRRFMEPFRDETLTRRLAAELVADLAERTTFTLPRQG